MPVNFEADKFLREHWQQQPLLMAASFPHLVDIVSGDDLAGLACEEAAESRIISGFEIDQPWQCQYGSFDESAFASLPQTNWSLLVQRVDQWIEEVRAVLDEFDFLPRWRLEDIMASYAPIGGGVGPHFDYYDVFLIQTSGSREWRLGQQCDETSKLQANDEVKLLQEFVATDTFTLTAGDALYIPAGLSHWGQSKSDDCVTLSVGFRAPAYREIVATAMDILIEKLPAHERYTDTLQSIDKDSFKLNNHAERALDVLHETIAGDELRQALYQAFGELVTETDAMAPVEFIDATQTWTPKRLQSSLRTRGKIELLHDPASRWAWSESTLFVNGHAHRVDQIFARQVCNQCITGPISDEQYQLLSQWIEAGLLRPQ